MNEDNNRANDSTPDSSTPPTGWTPPRTVLVGVIGGLGPAATIRLYQLVVAKLQQRHHDTNSICCDADHIPLLIYNNPQIPNNNAAVTGTGPPSLPALVYTAQALARAGATHIAMPCNTAHVFADVLQQQLQQQQLEFIHMVKLTAQRVKRIAMECWKCAEGVDPSSSTGGREDCGSGESAAGKRNVEPQQLQETSNDRCFVVGLMGTIGTMQSRLYHDVLLQESSSIGTQQLGVGLYIQAPHQTHITPHPTLQVHHPYRFTVLLRLSNRPSSHVLLASKPELMLCGIPNMQRSWSV